MDDKQLLTGDDEGTGAKPSEVEYVVTETDPTTRNKSEVSSAADSHDDEDDHEVDPENPDADDDERAELRERRRKEKNERKLRAREAMQRDKLELDFLRKRNDELERRMSAQEQRAAQQDLGLVDQRLREAQNEAQLAEQVIAKAIAAGNGEDVTKALRYRDEALARAQQLNHLKIQATQVRPPAEPGLDPRVQKLAVDFISENSWYDPQGRDEDSAIVLAIDSALVRDGYDPSSPDYWNELRSRAARRLPERFKSEDAPARREVRGGPRVGGGKEHVPTSSRKEVYISPERKQALIDAGVWDNPELRNRYIKRYAAYDAENRK